MRSFVSLTIRTESRERSQRSRAGRYFAVCYQVSDTTVRDRRIRRTVLSHALLSYVFGAAIVGGSANLIAGLIH